MLAMPGMQPLDLTIVEPLVALTKSANPVACRWATWSRSRCWSTTSPASHADAFDVTVVDTLPAGLTYVPGSASLTPAVSGQTAHLHAGHANARRRQRDDHLPRARRLGRRRRRSADQQRDAYLRIGPGATGAPDSGRNGSGGVDDYTDSSSADVTPNANAQIRADKTVALVSRRRQLRLGNRRRHAANGRSC